MKSEFEEHDFKYGDAVAVRDRGETLEGHVVGLHGAHEDEKVDVRIDSSGHKLHGYTKTYLPEQVRASVKKAAAEKPAA